MWFIIICLDDLIGFLVPQYSLFFVDWPVNKYCETPAKHFRQIEVDMLIY